MPVELSTEIFLKLWTRSLVRLRLLMMICMASRLSLRKFSKSFLVKVPEFRNLAISSVWFKWKELAVKAGVSVVEDKRKILFGHPAVDLTEELLLALEETK